MPLPQKKLIPSILLMLALAALAVPPLWWSAGVPPVIAPGATENNQGPANIGQAKHMAKSALDALRPILPAVAAEIQADLTEGTNPILDFTVPNPKTPDWIEKQKTSLLIGQLKAISAPFYTRLHAAAPTWLAAERTTNGKLHPNSIFPWTAETTDDANNAIATIGQLKAVFSLRFESLPPQDSDGDGIPDAYETAHGLNPNTSSDASGDHDSDGLSNLQEYQNGTLPNNPDTDGDGLTDGQEAILGTNPNTANNPGISNGDFSDPKIGTGLIRATTYDTWASVPNWKAIVGNNIEYQNFQALNNDRANQYCELKADPAGNHGIQQTIGTVEGKTYLIIMDCKARNGNILEHNNFDIRKGDGPAPTTPTIIKSVTFSDYNWTKATATFTAQSTITTISLLPTNLTKPAFGCLVDNVTLLPVDLISDLNNDGQITAADNLLRDAAAASGATDEIKDKGTEFIFHNDTLSNGAWDKEDTVTPGKPADADDDDAEPILVGIGSLPDQTEVWLEHPASTNLKFYCDKKCTQEIPLSTSQRHVVGGSVSWPADGKLFMRADGNNLTYPPADPQFAGELVLKIKVGTNGQEIEAVKVKLTVVKAVGAKNYFHAARDYMFENNSKLCVRKEAVGNSADPSYKRLITMLHEKTEMKAVDTFHRNPKLYGIDAVAAGFPTYDLALNGNFCYYSQAWIGSRPTRNAMTDKCHGYLVTGSATQLSSSVGGNSPFESVQADYIGFKSTGIEVKTGVVPVNPASYSEALGGFGSNLSQYGWHPWYGLANVGDKKVFFVAMPFTVDGNGAGGGASLKQRLSSSGCPQLPGGQAGEIQCIAGDGGSSLGLSYKIENGAFMTKTKGEKHFYSTATGPLRNRGDYFINTYLLFKSTNPR